MAYRCDVGQDISPRQVANWHAINFRGQVQRCKCWRRLREGYERPQPRSSGDSLGVAAQLCMVGQQPTTLSLDDQQSVTETDFKVGATVTIADLQRKGNPRFQRSVRLWPDPAENRFRQRLASTEGEGERSGQIIFIPAHEIEHRSHVGAVPLQLHHEVLGDRPTPADDVGWAHQPSDYFCGCRAH